MTLSRPLLYNHPQSSSKRGLVHSTRRTPLVAALLLVSSASFSAAQSAPQYLNYPSDTPATQRQRVMNIGASRSASVRTDRTLAECR